MTFLMMDVIGEKQKNGCAIIPALIQKENWYGILILQKRTAKNWWMQSIEYLGMFQSLEERQAQVQNNYVLPDNILS